MWWRAKRNPSEELTVYEEAQLEAAE